MEGFRAVRLALNLFLTRLPEPTYLKAPKKLYTNFHPPVSME